jgi:hypothetical protein
VVLFVSTPTATVNLSGWTLVVAMPEVDRVDLPDDVAFAGDVVFADTGAFVTAAVVWLPPAVVCAVAFCTWFAIKTAATPAASIPASRMAFLFLEFRSDISVSH